MSGDIKAAADRVLKGVTEGSRRVPGVVAIATDRTANTYEGAFGERVLGGAAMTTDTIFRIFSCTKAVTGVAAMQCVEEGLLDLDRPARDYLPEIGELQVMEKDGSLRPPRTEVTTRMLLLHTAGFGYDFFNQRYFDHGKANDIPSVVSSSRKSLETPLLHEPGTDWEYGSNIDWAGRVVEAVRGKRLGDVMKERIFEPLGMKETAFTIPPGTEGRLATIHARQADGSLAPMADFELPQEPEVHMGGHGLYAPIPDYMRFIRMFLNEGRGEGGRVVKPETVKAMAANGLDKLKVKTLPGVIKSLSNDAEFFPGQPKSWGLTLMINDEKAPTGRPAGGLGWAGLANLYYWIDIRNGLGGMWATQIFPFADPVSFGGFMDFETAVYRASEGRLAA